MIWNLARLTVFLSVACIALWALPAAAQTTTELVNPKAAPWEQGVSQERQQRAMQLFNEGNAYLEQSRFQSAADKYTEALEAWDHHPAINYNLARMLSRQGKLLAEHEHLTKALAYGEAGLGPARFKRALEKRSSIELQLAKLDLSCDIPGAEVRIDNNYLMSCPGHLETFVLHDTYTISVRKSGYPYNDRLRKLEPGKTTTLRFDTLYDTAALSETTTQWPVWRPLALLGASVALAGGGVALHLKARESYQNFDKDVTHCGIQGCEPGSSVLQLSRRGNFFQKAAFGAYTLGGAAAVTGVLLMALNGKQTINHTPDELDGLKVQVSATKSASTLLATVHF
jgi:tetratricopeptide (TPR) repeat protein